MEKKEKILNYLYPTKDIKKEIDYYNKKTLPLNVLYVIGFVLIGNIIIVLSFLFETKVMFIVNNLLHYLLLTLFFILLNINNKKRMKLEKQQLKIIVEENLKDNLVIVNNRNKYYLKSKIILTIIFSISLGFSLHNFIEGLVKDDYTSNPILVFYFVVFLFLIPLILVFIISGKFFITKQLNLIEEIEKTKENN